MIESPRTRIENLSKAIIKSASDHSVMIATAESCTGGLIGGALTNIAGSSAAFDRGFITYSNEAKNELLGVPMEMIEKYGAVSEEVARVMAEGALERSNAGIAVSVTGVAGPGGGTKDKPVGLVWFGLARGSKATQAEHHVFEAKGRAYIREQTVLTALQLILNNL